MISLNEIVLSVEIGLIYSIISMGVFLTFRVINFPDLTCDGSFVLGAATTASLIKLGMNPWLVLFFAFASGFIAGFLTAILFIKFKSSDLLSGILVSFMLYSINLHIMGGIPNIAFDEILIFSKYPIKELLIITAVLLSILSVVFLTDFGLAIRVVGYNKKLSKINGVEVPLMIMITLAFSNAMISLGGSLLAQHQGFADVGSGVGVVIVALSSIMLGEKIFKSRSFFLNLLSCVIGSIIYRLLIACALYTDVLGLKAYDINLITGLIIIVILNSSDIRIINKKY